MSINFSGVGSGLPVSDWISALMQVERVPIDRLYNEKYSYQTTQSVLGTVEAKFSSLRSSIENITDSNLGSAFDVFGKKTASTSDADIATATATNSAAIQEITLKINNLATATTAQSTIAPGGAIADGGVGVKVTDLGNHTGTEGSFSLYTDGTKHEITVDEDTTIDQVISDINSISGLTATMVDGKFKIDVDDATISDFRMGSTTDDSNFLNITQLVKVAKDTNPATPDNIDYVESSNILSSVYTGGLLVGNEAGLTTEVTAGEFKVGNATITIDEDSTLDDIIGEINSNSDAGAIAQYDSRSNTFKIVAKDPGETAISLENASGGSNFLEVMGLTTADGRIADGSQTLGKNASIEINGNAIEASTNTISSDISGINGLTINLNSVSTDEAENTVKINVGQDNDTLISALQSFVDKFNNVISEVDANTGSTGALSSEYSLVSIRNDLRASVTDSISDNDKYNSLGMIGITSGSFGTDVSADTSVLSLDKDTLLEALAEDPNAVKTLLIGDDENGITGILETLEQKVEDSLNTEYGYFSAREDGISATIQSINKSIEDGESRLEATQTRLTQQFTYMDQIISEMSAQSQYF